MFPVAGLALFSTAFLCTLNLASSDVVLQGGFRHRPSVSPASGWDVAAKIEEASLDIPAVSYRVKRSVNATSVQRAPRVQRVPPGDVLFGISKDFAARLMWVLEELLVADGITTECMSSLLSIYSGILRKDVWALKFVDSTGKVPSGLFQGTTSSLGSYGECLSIRVPSDVAPDSRVVGRYCLLRWNVTDPLQLRGTPHVAVQQLIPSVQFGICIPSQCSGGHLRAVAAKMLKAEFSAVSASSCRSVQDSVVNRVHVAVIAILSAWCTIIVLATLIHLYWSAKQPPANATETGERSASQSFLTAAVLALSAITSTKRLYKPDPSNSPRRITHGIRVMAVLWILLGQTYELQTFQALSSPNSYYDWRNHPLYSLIINWRLAFTALFLAGGVIGTGAILEKSSSGIGTFSLTAAVLLRRYIALTIPAMTMVGIFILFPVLLDGPFANDILPKLTSTCYRQWWTVLLHFNNCNGLRNICYTPLWYVACQFQLCTIVCLPIIALVRSRNIGMIAMTILCAAAVVGVAVQTTLYGYYPFPTLLPGYDIRNASRTLSTVFFLPFLHVPAIIVGAVAAYWALKDGDKSQGNTPNFVCWALAIISLTCAVFSPYIWQHWVPSAASAIFLVGSRLLFACSLGWLVFASLRNKFGFLSRVLSCSCFVPLSRLYMAAYLISTMVTMVPTLGARELIYAGHSILLGQFLQNSITSFVLAYVFYLLAGGPADALKDVVWKHWIASSDRKEFHDELDSKKVRFLSELLQPSRVPAEKPRPLHKIASLKDIVVCHL